MSWTIKTTFIFIIFISAWLMQEQVQNYDTTRTIVKSAANKATHDSLQMIDRNNMMNGIITFNKVQARKTFEESLMSNLGLNSLLQPNPKSAVSSTVEVVKFDIIDDLTPGVVFPYVYEDTTFKIFKVLRGPSIIAVIRTKSSAVAKYNGQTLTASSISEYTFAR